MPNQSERWDAVAEAVVQRMNEFRPRLRQASLVRLSGISDPTIRGIMNGDPRGAPGASTLRTLEDALQMPEHYLDQLLAGEPPGELDPVIPPPDDAPELREFAAKVLAEMNRMATEIVTNADLVTQLRVDVDGLLERERRRVGQESG